MNHNQDITPTDKDWYNAGIMAQRILQNDEIKKLKSQTNEAITNYAKAVLSIDELKTENEILKRQNSALQDRIKIMQEQLAIASEQVPKGAFEFNHLKK